MSKSTGLIIIIASLVVVLSGSILASRVFVFLLFILCLFLGSKEPSFLNPYYLFSITPLSLLMYVNVSGNFMMDLEPRTWGLAIINMVAFILALYYSGGFKAWRTCTGPSDKMLLTHTIIFTIVGLFSAIFEYLM